MGRRNNSARKERRRPGPEAGGLLASHKASNRESPKALHCGLRRPNGVRVGKALAKSERGHQELRPEFGHRRKDQNRVKAAREGPRAQVEIRRVQVEILHL